MRFLTTRGIKRIVFLGKHLRPFRLKRIIHLKNGGKVRETRPIIATVLSPEEIDDVLCRIEAKIAEYEREIGS